MKKIFLFSFVQIITSGFYLAHGQEKSLDLLENVHLHLNKTVFSQGERLWFAAYVQDQKAKLPSSKTTNLHVGLFDLKGEVVKRKIYHVESGISHGDFAIDSTFTNSDYMLIAWTNYSQNYKELQPYRQKIKILNQVDKDKTSEKSKGYKLNVYPEGGRLIKNAFNLVAIQLQDGLGNGIFQDSLCLVTDKGKIVQNKITTSKQGYGRIGFVVEDGKEYYLRFGNENNQLLTQKLPQAVSDRLGIQLYNTLDENILINFIGSKKFFKDSEHKVYTLVIFQNENLFTGKYVVNGEVQSLRIDRNMMPYGINTIVLLDDKLMPVTHRMFFNYRQDDARDMPLEIGHAIDGDSLILNINTKSKTIKSASLSLSILPTESKAYNPNNSLTSSFLLSPYFKKEMNGLKYYMYDDNKQLRYELDTRLIFEGWGRYHWDSTKQRGIQVQFMMENGFQVTGKIIDADLTKEKQIYVTTGDNKAFAYGDLKNDKTFNLNMPLYANDSIGITLLGNKGKLRKAKIETNFTYVIPKIIFDPLQYSCSNQDIEPVPEEDIDMTQNNIFGKGIIALDEVSVSEKSLKDDKILVSPYSELKMIDDEDIQKTPSLLAYLTKQGIKPVYVDGVMYFQSNRMINPIKPPHYEYYSVSVDGRPTDPGEVVSMPLSSIRAIVVTKASMGFSSGTNFFIGIQLREGFYVAPEKRDKFVKFLIKKGFSRPQEYFDPGYDLDTKLFSYFGAIDWRPRVILSNEKPTSISIPLHKKDKVVLYVEGMGIDGSLISTSKVIELPTE
ncbi:hypothetical protein [Costertonia aggregata]|uniref:Plug domain-containing protein n=1 Tax=Costertonia aggregata TaxID=343403 RepID=A0A7H9AR38_9FLAO|nr:hypothetical protein [Costertonia aggregata]QLG45876.1 hypothetical protein HYG79_11130 [Costertonia aggregata]